MASRNGKRPLVADRRRTARKPAKASAAKKPRKAPRRKATRARKQRGLLGWILAPFVWILSLIWRFTWRIGIVSLLILGAAVAYVYSTLPEVTDIVDGRVRGSVTLLDRNGAEFAWRGEQFGGMVTADQVSRHLRHAVIATEDKRFRYHPGVDPIGIASAVKINMREGRGPLSGHGGSTLTQQTAKLLCLGVAYDPTKWENEAAYEADCRRTTLARKLKEAVYALAMEVKFTKDEILTIYLNRAFLGFGRGFEAAANRYFGKSAAQLTPAEAAMLAGMLKAPSTYAPTRNLSRAQNRGAVVVGLMEDQGYLTQAEADDARAHPAQLSEAAQAAAGGYFADWVMEQGPDFFTRTTTEDVLIRTTLDQRIQKAAEDALLYVFENKVREGSKAQAAIVVMSADGAVRAMVGGRDVRASGVFNRATQALRQTGSAFKPFVYATAMEMGRDPMSIVVDEPTCWNVPGSGQWCPSNYTNTFLGPVTLTDALKKSLNVPTVKLSEDVGRDLVRTVAGQFGIENEIDAGPALALGTSESTLIEMTGAYAGILNGGSAVAPYGLESLQLAGDSTPLMGSSGGIRERVIRQKVAQQLIWMMWNVVEQGTGARAKIGGVQVAGKTGTTQSARDAWFIGFTGDYVTGVWMGYDDNTPLRGVTGGGLPAEIWHETMVRVLDGRQSSPLPMLPPDRPAVIPSPGNVASTNQLPGAAQPAPQQPGLVEGILRGLLGGN
ncbi:MAG: glycosyl transferase [Rhodobacterales bacterium]|nr:MAG: glycosyl transferase [Rhodobacterales bacterium]